MDANELRQKKTEELNEELLSLRKEQFNLRMQQATGQLVRPDEVKKARRNIARVKTIMREQEKSQSQVEAGK